MAAENIAYRLIREPETQVGHGAHDPVNSPTRDFPSPSAPPTARFPRHLGRPQDLRNFDPSNLLAMSFRYQARSVSGFATAANSPKAFRLSRWAISANVAFSASDNSNRPLIWPLRIRFSAARYSFLSKSSWSTVPGDVSKHASPNHSRASLYLIVEPGLYMLLRFQKAGVGGNYETGNQAFSMRLRFLTIRAL
jgi:hypothetical protein